MRISEVRCKSALSKSALADYALNCYIGCQHACVYCYAQFMMKFTGHDEEWGEFVDVRVNIAEVLLRELPRKRVGRIMISSVCDGWQPLEEKYELTRRCMEFLIAYGHEVSILTKNALVLRDLDLLAGKKNVELGMTVTTPDEDLRRVIEPAASTTACRFEALKKASRRGIRTWLFIGPLLPFLSDTREHIDCLMGEAASLPLTHIYVDTLNRRPGVWLRIKRMLREHFPELIPRYQKVLFDSASRGHYLRDLRRRFQCSADDRGVSGITFAF